MKSEYDFSDGERGKFYFPDARFAFPTQAMNDVMLIPIMLKAHFDGEQIRLDEPFELEPNTELLVTVMLANQSDDEHEAWMQLSMQLLERAYSGEEPDYSMVTLKEKNPAYEGPSQ